MWLNFMGTIKGPQRLAQSPLVRRTLAGLLTDLDFNVQQGALTCLKVLYLLPCMSLCLLIAPTAPPPPLSLSILPYPEPLHLRANSALHYHLLFGPSYAVAIISVELYRDCARH